MRVTIIGNVKENSQPHHGKITIRIRICFFVSSSLVTQVMILVMQRLDMTEKVNQEHLCCALFVSWVLFVSWDVCLKKVFVPNCLVTLKHRDQLKQKEGRMLKSCLGKKVAKRCVFHNVLNQKKRVCQMWGQNAAGGCPGLLGRGFRPVLLWVSVPIPSVKRTWLLIFVDDMDTFSEPSSLRGRFASTFQGGNSHFSIVHQNVRILVGQTGI